MADSVAVTGGGDGTEGTESNLGFAVELGRGVR
jgi:hypothetical protein